VQGGIATRYLDRTEPRQPHPRNGGNQMSEMSSETGSSTASDSGGGSAAEAGTSGPAEADDQMGAGSAANDNMPQAASDASTEGSYDDAVSFPAEPGEAGPPGVGDEVNFPDAGDEAFPEVGDEVPDLLPGTEASQTTMADSSTSGSDIWKRTITPDFNKPAGPNDGSGGKDDGDKTGGEDPQRLTPPDKLTPEHTPPDTFINPKTPAP
jgi:hypothetical protein